MKPNRNRNLLHPLFLAKLSVLETSLADDDLAFRLHEGYRGRARQERGKANGSSRVGFGSSMHNWGLAADFVGDVKGVNPWDGSHNWQAYGERVRRAGLNWAGDWKSFVEFVHCDCLTAIAKAYGLPNSYSAVTRAFKQGLLVEYSESFGCAKRWLVWLKGFVSNMEADGETRLVNIFRQKALQLRGLYNSEIDGIWGPISRAALDAANGEVFTSALTE